MQFLQNPTGMVNPAKIILHRRSRQIRAQWMSMPPGYDEICVAIKRADRGLTDTIDLSNTKQCTSVADVPG